MSLSIGSAFEDEGMDAYLNPAPADTAAGGPMMGRGLVCRCL